MQRTWYCGPGTLNLALRVCKRLRVRRSTARVADRVRPGNYTYNMTRAAPPTPPTRHDDDDDDTRDARQEQDN